MKRWKKLFHAKGNENKARVAISDNINFKPDIPDQINLQIETITRDKESHYIIIKKRLTDPTRRYKNYVLNILYRYISVYKYTDIKTVSLQEN